MGSAYMPHRSGIDLSDLGFEPIDSPTEFRVRDYDLRKGVYTLYGTNLTDMPARCFYCGNLVICPDCGDTVQVDNIYDTQSAAVFVDGELVEYQMHGSNAQIEVNSSGESRFNFHADHVIAYRIKTKWEG